MEEKEEEEERKTKRAEVRGISFQVVIGNLAAWIALLSEPSARKVPKKLEQNCIIPARARIMGVD